MYLQHREQIDDISLTAVKRSSSLLAWWKGRLGVWDERTWPIVLRSVLCSFENISPGY